MEISEGSAALRLHPVADEQVGRGVRVGGAGRQLHRFDRRGPALRLVGHADETAASAGLDVEAAIRTVLMQSLGRDRFERMLSGGTRMGVESGTLVVTARTKAAAGLIERRIGAELRESATSVLGPQAAVRIDVSETIEPVVVDSPPEKNGQAEMRPPATSRAAPVRTVRTYRLEEFVVGESNRLAYNAALQVAELGGTAASAGAGVARAPLFLHGPCGVGKTHLLQGLAARFRDRHPGAVVRVVSGETFLNEFVSALRHGGGGAMTGQGRSAAMGGSGGGIERFRRQYRRCDLLCIDDVHLLASKQATQQELLHTFDQIAQSGAQVVLACDRHPREMREESGKGAGGGSRLGGFTPALVSRFLSGMVAAIEPPDGYVRERALRMFAQRRGLVLEEPAVRMLVERTAVVPGQAPMSVRDLEGLLTRVEAVQRVDVGDGAASDGPVRIGILAVRRALGIGEGDLSPMSTGVRRPLRAEQIVAHVCLALGVERSDLSSSTRHKRVVLARAVITHVCRELTTMSYPEIARAIGRPSHSTVITAHQRLAKQIAAGEVWGIGASGEGVTIAGLVREVVAGLVK